MSNNALWHNFWLLLAITIMACVLHSAWPLWGLLLAIIPQGEQS